MNDEIKAENARQLKAAALEHAKSTVDYLALALMDVAAGFKHSQEADSLNGIIGSLVSEPQRLREIADDIESLMRLARRVQQ